MADTPFVTDSPLLARPGAVPAPAGTPDTGLPWHYGDPFGEQRAALTGVAVVDRSTRFVVAISGEERLSWLHTISSQHVAQLPDGTSAENLSLDAQGRVEHHFVQTDLDGVTWIDTEPQRGPDLLTFLSRMVFWSKAEPRDGNEMAVLSLLGPRAGDAPVLAALGIDALPADVYAAVALPGGGLVRRMPWPTDDAWDLLVPRERLTDVFAALVDAGARPAGTWAFEALRVVALRPRIGLDTDERTIPHEARWIGGPAEHGAVHLDKGCYRGQETVARVHNLGKPPRHLVLLHLDGSAEGRPEPGDPVTADGRAVGRLGTVVDHFELGPVALALIKRNVPVGTALVAGPCAAAIDPDSIPDDATVQAGRLAVERLRGR
ncbi:folate-binding protein YgfZ [Rhodococcus ruber]|uniref:CAF17-like 4Fe-4S cluster assembly/insertion protein YgfZ n=1 Tax=Rhodococcus TaxID=1827 RepID=UPI000C7C4093|nr:MULTISPECIES: folate-binding protein YgfZ [Rhodococcus]MDO2378820.1 folate-binding protein YgfZ [Rhodococcus ruber]RIK14093.1 MAG: folate-binding protein [Acidobacteriota bacterium]AUM16522.1 folate-binding protein YgfZ [Rhodococcus ruber]MBD8052244.1 folate-binding protein YgfZ [Rhodococcus ruber]MCF8784203.1 folate-binding protein YgfZ [Rhodococcus ruber]